MTDCSREISTLETIEAKRCDLTILVFSILAFLEVGVGSLTRTCQQGYNLGCQDNKAAICWPACTNAEFAVHEG